VGPTTTTTIGEGRHGGGEGWREEGEVGCAMIVSLLSFPIYNPNFPILHPSSQTSFRSFEERERERERERDLFKCDHHHHHPSFKFPHSPIPLLLICICNPLLCIHSKGKQEGRGTKKQRKKKLGS
jgi:hypothetical protein